MGNYKILKQQVRNIKKILKNKKLKINQNKNTVENSSDQIL
jgi:hypothetical protein